VLTTYSRPRWYAAGSFDALGAVEHMVDGARCPGSLVVLHPRPPGTTSLHLFPELKGCSSSFGPDPLISLVTDLDARTTASEANNDLQS
jgi:hypothetical protein